MYRRLTTDHIHVFFLTAVKQNKKLRPLQSAGTEPEKTCHKSCHGGGKKKNLETVPPELPREVILQNQSRLLAVVRRNCEVSLREFDASSMLAAVSTPSPEQAD